MSLNERDYNRGAHPGGSHPPACTCVECSRRPEPGNNPKRVSRPSRGKGLWRRFKQAPWTTNVLLVGGSLSLAAFVLYPAAMASWLEENLQQKEIAEPSTAAPAFSPTSELRPLSRALQVEPASSSLSVTDLDQYRLQLLGLENSDREANVLFPVVLGNNSAAQNHAEDMLRHDYISHWDTQGLTPYMRYTMAGGEAFEAENVALGYGSNTTDESLKQAQKWLMNSPGHRRNILDKWHNRVNLGVACDEFACAVVQQFESDYVSFTVRPSIWNGVLRFAGELKGDFALQGADLWYDQSPNPLTMGQLDATNSYAAGQRPATFLRKPLSGDSYYPESSAQHSYQRSVDPYSLDPNIPRSSTPQKSLIDKVNAVPWITATTWKEAGQYFEIEANISSVLNDLGPGVYTLIIWGNAGGESVPLTKFSLFMG